MLDAFFIFTKGGIVLWSFSLAALKGNPVDSLIRSCLLEERAGESSYAYTSDNTGYTLKWSFHNELDLVFVAVFQRVLQLSYVDDLLVAVKKQFAEGHYRPSLRAYPEFEDEFRRILRECEQKSEATRKPRQISNYDPGKKAKEKGGRAGDDDADGPGRSESSASLTAAGSSGDLAGSTDASGAFDLSKLKAKTKKGVSPAAPAAAQSGGKPATDEGKKKKKGRVWGNGEPGAKLDFSDKPPEGFVRGGDDDEATPSGPSAMDVEEDSSSDEEEEQEGGRADAGAKASKSASKGWFNSVLQSSMVTSVVGKASLEHEDVAPILEQLKMNLLRKNVAAEIADRLAESVANGLVGRRQASFTSLSSTVRASMEEALKRILTPKRSTDILREAQAARERGRPYTIVFVGVNGVGKSTNLAKVAYWLQSHSMKVMIAACDTFRAGAVEQLRTHCTRLGLPLFERGYEKDPAAVAAEAVKAAQKAGCDVVLVDTAGRMQDNEPLMRALSKLINVNKPDLVLFVGEALVGNDAVDQLSKFNQRLADLAADPSTRHLIDGIVLTKFDTIDDKVGAALSMVYQSGAPIMFVGCGQTYTDLRRFNVSSIVKSLLR